MYSTLTQNEKKMITALQQNQVDSSDGASEFALGNILVTGGQITRSQLDEALDRQIETGLKLGEELVSAGHANQSQIDSGILLQRKFLAYTLALSVGLSPLLTSLNSAEAAQINTPLQVSVIVLAKAKLQTYHQATQLNISQNDVARGYVEVSSASLFSVSSNSQSGYLIELNPIGNVFESVQVRGLGSAIELNAEGGHIVQRGFLPTQQTHELSFHFKLNKEVTPGSYVWPLQLSVRAL